MFNNLDINAYSIQKWEENAIKHSYTAHHSDIYSSQSVSLSLVLNMLYNHNGVELLTMTQHSVHCTYVCRLLVSVYTTEPESLGLVFLAVRLYGSRIPYRSTKQIGFSIIFLIQFFSRCVCVCVCVFRKRESSLYCEA